MKIQSILFAFLIPLVGACGDDGATSSTSDATTDATTGSSSSASGTTAGSATTSATTQGSGSASAGATTGTDASGTSTTEATSGATGTTGSTGSTSAGTTGGGDAILESCEAACGSVFDCFPEDFDSLAACIEECVDESTPLEPDPACEDAVIKLNECIAAGSCDDFDAPDFCVAEEVAVDESCGGGCIDGGGSNIEGTECFVSEECPGDYKLELRCTTDLCECYEDDVKTAECSTEMNLCADYDPDELELLSYECCGW